MPTEKLSYADDPKDMPIAINTTPAASPSASPRTTTTSRRGGRTRSRSPPVMDRLSGSAVAMPPSVGDNPSSAAAAAAAAAKAFSSTRQSAPWEQQGRDDHHPPPYHHHGGYEKYPKSWSEDGRPVGPPQPPHYPRYAYGDGFPPGGPYRDDRGGYVERRYDDARGPRQYPLDYRGYGRERLSPKPHSRGGTTLVIGGTTPIHLPKTGGDAAVATAPPSQLPSMPKQSRPSRAASAASVFRGRPGTEARPPAETDDDSPQKILLSLRTPTTSFEEKDKVAKKSSDPLSPEDPPQIQNSHHQPFEENPIKTKASGSIETAPSFSLFNQSFDSFGDGHYFNVDSTLQADSFGIGRTASVDQDNAAQILRTGSGPTQPLLAASGSGALTLGLGYSPVNSFGNMSIPAARRSGSMMVVGGPDPRSSSPTQVLSMYRSYSGGGPPPRGGPLEDSHLKMSIGSFGAPSMAFSRSYGEHPPNFYYPPPQYHVDMSERLPSFYSFLKRYKAAFKECLFLLPGLKAALLEAPLTDAHEKVTKSMPGHVFGDPTPQDIAIARRRIECSVFAFGGNPSRDRTLKHSTMPDKSSIFRGKGEEKKESANVTPEGIRHHSRARTKYEEELPSRYYENESRLSWEFEENPPVIVGQDDDDENNLDGDSKNSSDKGYDRSKSDPNDPNKQGSDDSSGKRLSSSSPQPKMRYRCKLCGQPKQNHTCPYQQSLARSIGVMIFPAVNAFTAAEPGTIAPALTDMNNFVDQKDPNASETSSPNRPTPDRFRRGLTSGGTVTSTTQVTPETMRSSPRQSPSSFANNATPSRRNGMGRPPMGHVGRKRPFSHLSGPEESDLLFLEAMELKPEQFRMVTPRESLERSDAFTYPALPLPYAQRKRLSDNLFSLSNEVPKLTDECAQVLREAREKDMWDLAVAELMTQVVVILHCPDGDHRFEGLRQYLLTLGISC